MATAFIRFFIVLLVVYELPSTISSGTHPDHHMNCAWNPEACKILSDLHGCCFNRGCADMSSNVLHCGECGHRCEPGKECCKGVCVDTNRDMKNCGQCHNECPVWESCVYGMCGYG